MNPDQSVNFQSLNVVRDELIATIESAARELENFVNSGQEDVEALQSSIDGVQQIGGILRVLELDSAALLAQELLEVANAVPQGAAGVAFNRKLDTISNTFFILPRYLEYLEQTKRQLPVVLVPHINALRRLRNEAALPESQFVPFSVPEALELAKTPELTLDGDDLRLALRRARNMYQIGLMGLIQERQVKNSAALMRRAVKRVLKLCGSDKPLSMLWYLADLVLDVLASKNMSLLETRKHLFVRLDKIIRQLELNGKIAAESKAPKGLVKELFYLLKLSEKDFSENPILNKVLEKISLPYSESELQREYASLYGPSAHTISTLSHVLNTEIVSSKRTLENAAQEGVGYIEDLDSFISTLANISEILAVVGLGQASITLKEELQKVEVWRGADNVAPESMSSVADTLLYIESLITDLENQDLSSEKSKTDLNSRNAQVASQEFTSAIQIVKEECLGGLSLTKRALNSFSDSNYDTGHIKNISKTLNSIRGAMTLLKQERLAKVLSNSVEFVEEILFDSDLPAAINEVLETFADVIISVEYYFDSADDIENADESVLKIAEESLAALGYE